VKFFRSDHWANEFLNICKSFSERKDELRLALNIRTVLRVDIAIDKLEQLIKMQSERELRFEKEVKLRGGREKCLESPDILVKLLDTSEQLETRPQNRSQIEPLPRDDNKPISKTADVSLLLHELRAPLNSLLEENRAYFRLTLDKQTSRITDTINASEERIIRTINIGNIFQQVNDPVRIWLSFSLGIANCIYITRIFSISGNTWYVFVQL
jgi:signal transduction histidine kinase